VVGFLKSLGVNEINWSESMRDEYENKAKVATDRPSRPGEIGGAAYASRQSGKSALFERIHRLRMEADSLQALHDSLPSVMTQDADEGLWNLVVKAR
jgi:hypothetical protein